jgi:outer membrane receptor protein involved in Fe transport
LVPGVERSADRGWDRSGLAPDIERFTVLVLNDPDDARIAGIPRYDLNWSDAVYFDPNEGRGTPAQDGRDPLPQYGVGQNPFFLHNVRLAYRTPTGNVEVAGWVRNLTDEVYKNYAFDASAFAQLVLNFVGEPRTIGMDLTITF